MATAKQDTAPATSSKRKSRQSPPVRLPESLYKRVNASATLNSRSIPKHLEHLVNIAETVTQFISRKELLDVQSGLRKIVVEQVDAPRVDKAGLFNSMETMRKAGTLSQAVTAAGTKYQASANHPGYLERINEDGSRDIGMFKNGRFKIARDPA